MGEKLDCRFCNELTVSLRTIRVGSLVTSVVASPWVRPGHCIILPNRHANPMDRLTLDERDEMHLEVARLTPQLDEGNVVYVFGSDRGPIRDDSLDSHARYHVIPRQAGERLDPNPEGNRYTPLIVPTNDEVAAYAVRLSAGDA